MSEKSLESESYSERRVSIKLKERAHETREPLELDAEPEPEPSSFSSVVRFSDDPFEKWKHFIGEEGRRDEGVVKEGQWKIGITSVSSFYYFNDNGLLFNNVFFNRDYLTCFIFF